jgi:hypothetical protein
MTDYYQLLGISRTASAEEIKRSYRRLAIKYHPDKNSDPILIEHFKEISLAYSTLSDERKKWVYDQQLYRHENHKEDLKPEQRPRDPAYRPQNRPPVYRKSERQRLRELMQQYLPFALRISQISLILCLILLVDYGLPFEVSNEMILKKYAHIERSRGTQSFHSSDVIITDAGRGYKISLDKSEFFKSGEEVKVYFSSIIQIPIKIVSAYDIRSKFHGTIYGNFIFAPMILLFTSLLGSLYKKGIEFRFNLGIVNFFILFLTVVFLFSHKLF